MPYQLQTYKPPKNYISLRLAEALGKTLDLKFSVPHIILYAQKLLVTRNKLNLFKLTRTVIQKRTVYSLCRERKFNKRKPKKKQKHSELIQILALLQVSHRSMSLGLGVQNYEGVHILMGRFLQSKDIFGHIIRCFAVFFSCRNFTSTI